MAKGTTGKAFKQEARQALPEQQEILRDLGKQKAEVEKIKQSYDKLNDSLRNTTANSSAHYKVQQKINDLLRQYDGDVKNLLHNLEDVNGAFDDQKKKIKALKSELTDYVDNFGELEGLQASITNQYGRQSVQAKSLEAIVDKTKAQYNGITSILNSNADIQGHQRDVILQALDTYKNFPVVLNGLEKQLKRNEITAEGFQDSIIKTEQGFQDLLNQMDEMVPGIKEIKTLLEELPGIMQKNATAAAAMKKQFEGIDAAQEMGNFAFGGIAGASGVISSAAQMRKDSIAGVDLKTVTLVGALIGLMELAASIEGKGLARAEAQNEIISKRLDLELEIAEARVKYNNKLPETKALLDYTYELKGLQNQFAASAQTALFGGALGEMPYVTEQMEMAGIGAETVVSAMHDLSTSANMGIFPQLAANAAVFAKKMGISTSELGTQIGLYRRLNKVGGAQAMARVQTSISRGGIDPTTFSSDMADASKLTMFYNIKSYEALSKQVKAVRMLGASFAEIGEAGKNMVLNYKDSIKSEMELSAMLGERVDLSEVRSLFAAGQGDKALEVLKSSGILEKAQAQGMFSVQALQGALQGMDLTQLGAAKYQVGQSINAPSNAGFLQSLQDAMKNLKIATAYLDVDKLVDTAMYTAEETRLLRGDKTALGVAGEIKTNEAANFLRKVVALLSAPGGVTQDMYDAMKNKSPEIIKTFLPDKAPGTEVDIAKFVEAASKFIGKPLYPDIPGRSGATPAGTDFNKNPSQKKIDFLNPNNIDFFGNGTQPNVSTGKGIDYFSRMPDKQQEVINVSKMQDAKLKELNSKNETSIQLLKSLRDLTAIMLDPDREKDFNVQLNMDGKQIHNVLIRKTENDKGSLKGGVTFATK